MDLIAAENALTAARTAVREATAALDSNRRLPAFLADKNRAELEIAWNRAVDEEIRLTKIVTSLRHAR